MQTLADIAKSLNRPVAHLRGLQTRFALPVTEGAGYSDAYSAFLRTLVFLRTFGVSEDALVKLWNVEKKLLTLLHVDSAGSPTWFLDSCGRTTHRERRLLLTNHDLGVEISAKMLQPSLDFGSAVPELFADREMGVDALRVLGEYLKQHARIQADVDAELPLVLEAARWATRLRKRKQPSRAV